MRYFLFKYKFESNCLGDIVFYSENFKDIENYIEEWCKDFSWEILDTEKLKIKKEFYDEFWNKINKK